MTELQESDDEQFSRLFRQLDSDAPGVNRDAINEARSAAAAVFLDSDTQQSSPVKEHSEDVSRGDTSKQTKGWTMKTMIGISAIAAAVCMMFAAPEGGDKAATLGERLDEIVSATSLQLSLDDGKRKSRVFVQDANLVRQEFSETQYSIATGLQMMKVDETDNRVETSSSPWHDSDSKLSLLRLLGVDKDQASQLRRAKPSQEAGDEDNVERYVAGKSTILVSYQLDGGIRELRCWPGGYDPDVKPLRLHVDERDIAIDETKFVVATKLSQDGRIGKVTDHAGLVSLRPGSHRRWTPVARQTLVRPGDWFRTSSRGANAATIVMTALGKLVVGPASIVELVSPTEIRLHQGEIRFTAGRKAEESFTLLGQGDEKMLVSRGETKHLRIGDEGAFVEIKQRPAWLAGYESKSAEDATGSLIANIDGRTTKLSVGYHKVNVEIRDQIARTTIEESFVNHTSSRIEGIFHFPLPQDASISGFGMWIDGELVEADVVEKQRAREIFETILREKRDPGLLEWAGGNIFKARVFPILPSSEKRIKIVYTQVLPLRGGKYRYSYGLRSEMLQTTPVRELSIDVTLSSKLPIAKLHSPTHTVRSQQTEHSGRLEFTAQEYSPTKDFEVVCELGKSAEEIVIVPHQRGDDGYFMLQLTPPAVSQKWTRQLVADGDPLEILLLCDTSGSMDSEQRRRQREFVSAILGTLSEQDRFDIATCDVDCIWQNDELVSADDESREAAIEWLERRRSLGWSNLDVAIESVLGRAKDNTQVIYVGDGIVTSGDADGFTFVNRLKRMVSGKACGTFHAISLGSSFDSVVLKSLGAIGGGSVRSINSDQTPARAAADLIQEITAPGLRDIEVSFDGVRVAGLYPSELPNLASGTQLVMLARYLPQGKKQTGTITVQGLDGDTPVKFTSDVSLEESEEGNSFVPRLWARGHLDHLLQQGSSQAIRDQIIAMSEEFHIITPYTSLLVLESDADRERFGVKRRYEMRDGERFFADGTDDANFELRQQQMRLAGDWRLGLRRRTLEEMSYMGRSQNIHQRLPFQRTIDTSRMSSGGFANFESLMKLISNTAVPDTWTSLSDGTIAEVGSLLIGATAEISSVTAPVSGLTGGFAGQKFNLSMSGDYSGAMSSPFLDRRAGNTVVWDQEGDEFALVSEDKLGFSSQLSERSQSLFRPDLAMSYERVSGFVDRIGQQRNAFKRSSKPRSSSSRSSLLSKRELSDLNQPMGMGMGIGGGGGGGGWYGNYYQRQNYTQWINRLLPTMPRVPVTQTGSPTGDARAVRLLESAAKATSLDDDQWLQVVQKIQTLNPTWDRTTREVSKEHLASKKRWLTIDVAAGEQTFVNWCDADNRGILSRAFQLGRTRKSTDLDRESAEPGVRPLRGDQSLAALADYVASMLQQEDNTLVTLVHKKATTNRVTFTIDNEHGYVIEVRRWYQWKNDRSGPDHRMTYSGHKKIAGVWWPGKILSYNTDGKIIQSIKQTVRSLSEARFEKRFAQLSPDPKKSLLLALPQPSIRESKIAVRRSVDQPRDRLSLLLNACEQSDWDAAKLHLAALERLADGATCLPWIHAAVDVVARQNDDALGIYRNLVVELDKTDPQLNDREREGADDDSLWIAGHIIDQVGAVASARETLRVVESLKSVYQRQSDQAMADWKWRHRRAQWLRRLGHVESMAMQKQLALDAPWDANAQATYARDLSKFDDSRAAIAWLKQRIAACPAADTSTRQTLRQEVCQILTSLGDAESLVEFTSAWVEADPENQFAIKRNLAAFIQADREEKADAICKRWIAEARVPGKLDEVARIRLNEAILYAIGQRYSLYMRWVDEQWFEPLAETALYFLDHEHHASTATTILGNSYFAESKYGDQAFIEVGRRLFENVLTLAPEKIAAMTSQIRRIRNLNLADWQAIAKVLRQRWEVAIEDDSQDKVAEASMLLSALQSVLQHHLPEGRLPLLRYRILRADKMGNAAESESLREQLLSQLLDPSTPWTQAREDESRELISWAAQSAKPSQHVVNLPRQLRWLGQWMDGILDARIKQAMAKLTDSGNPQNLKRDKFAAEKAAIEKAANRGILASLQKLGRGKTEISAWCRLEAVQLKAELGDDFDSELEELWDLLDVAIPEGNASDIGEDKQRDPDVDAQSVNAVVSKSLRRKRSIQILSYLAVRRGSGKASADRLLKYLDEHSRGEDEAAVWYRDQVYHLLIALDRADVLEQKLTEWIGSDPLPSQWQLTLSRLKAEQGAIEDAVPLMEAVQQTERLSGADQRALADWYLVLDQRKKHNSARIAAFDGMDENSIRNWLSSRGQRWSRTDLGPPDELQEDELFAFQYVIRSSNNPESYLPYLATFYKGCGDFRLLSLLPDAVVGRTPQSIYPLLRSVSTQIIGNIRKEATSDQIIARIDELAKTDLKPIDRRALALLAAMVEQQAATVLNQPEAHASLANAALERAMEHQWLPGEPRQMAELLKHLSNLSSKSLRQQRLRHLKSLAQLCERQPELGDAEDLFQIRWHHAHVLARGGGDYVQGILEMETAISAYRKLHADGFPAGSNEAMFDYVSMLGYRSQFSDAERFLLAEINHTKMAPQRNAYEETLSRTYNHALRDGATVALGAGEDLYVALRARLIVRVDSMLNDSDRRASITTLMNFFRTAHQKGFSDAKTDLVEFGNERLSEVLKRQGANYTEIVGDVKQAISQIAGGLATLEFFVNQLESYPRRLDYGYQGIWRRYAYEMATLREKHDSGLGKFESRLLAVLQYQLRRDLETRHQSSRYIYGNSSGRLWKRKVADFVKISELVYQKNQDDARAISHVANYLAYSLNIYDRAIEMMQQAYDDEILLPIHESQLAKLYMNADQHSEAIPLLEARVSAEPANFQHRKELLECYARCERKNKWRKLHKLTLEEFRQQGRWIESVVIELARQCHLAGEYKLAITYFDEAIWLRSQKVQQYNDRYTLAYYYSEQADCYSKMGETRKAVESSSAAMMVDARRGAQNNFYYKIGQVLRACDDLDAFTKEQDSVSDAAGQDSPLIRKNIGMVYLQRQKYDQAITQLRAALLLQPTDAESHLKLIEALKATGDSEAARDQYLALIDIQRHNLDYYKQYLAVVGEDEGERERAVTMIVEAAPNEAEHHQAVAEIRHQQKRWDDSIAHWTKVASLRKLEPGGLLGLAKVQVAAGDASDARKTLDKLTGHPWPARFDNLVNEAETLRKSIKND